MALEDQFKINQLFAQSFQPLNRLFEGQLGLEVEALQRRNAMENEQRRRRESIEDLESQLGIQDRFASKREDRGDRRAMESIAHALDIETEGKSEAQLRREVYQGKEAEQDRLKLKDLREMADTVNFHYDENTSRKELSRGVAQARIKEDIDTIKARQTANLEAVDEFSAGRFQRNQPQIEAALGETASQKQYAFDLYLQAVNEASPVDRARAANRAMADPDVAVAMRKLKPEQIQEFLNGDIAVPLARLASLNPKAAQTVSLKFTDAFDKEAEQTENRDMQRLALKQIQMQRLFMDADERERGIYRQYPESLLTPRAPEGLILPTGTALPRQDRPLPPPVPMQMGQASIGGGNDFTNRDPERGSVPVSSEGLVLPFVGPPSVNEMFADRKNQLRRQSANPASKINEEALLLPFFEGAAKAMNVQPSQIGSSAFSRNPRSVVAKNPEKYDEQFSRLPDEERNRIMMQAIAASYGDPTRGPAIDWQYNNPTPFGRR